MQGRLKINKLTLCLKLKLNFEERGWGTFCNLIHDFRTNFCKNHDHVNHSLNQCHQSQKSSVKSEDSCQPSHDRRLFRHCTYITRACGTGKGDSTHKFPLDLYRQGEIVYCDFWQNKMTLFL